MFLKNSFPSIVNKLFMNIQITLKINSLYFIFFQITNTLIVQKLKLFRM
jgi:hypothetical protein